MKILTSFTYYVFEHFIWMYLTHFIKGIWLNMQQLDMQQIYAYTTFKTIETLETPAKQ